MNATLSETLKNLEKPSSLQSFTDPIDSIQVIVHKSREDKTIEISGLAPFHTIEDLHRAIWLAEDKDDDLFPKYTYLAFEDGEELVSALRVFVDLIDTSVESIKVPNPKDVIQSRKIQTSFVDDNGNKTPIDIRPRGRTTLEKVFLEKMGAMPIFHIFSFRYLLSLYNGPKPISERDWYGLFFPYFPALQPNENGIIKEGDKKLAEEIGNYITAKINQIKILNTLLDYVEIPEFTTTGVKSLKFQWTDTERAEMFEGVDTLFFSAAVNSARPYMRLLQPNATPMTKLYQPDPMRPPEVSDPVLLKNWVNEPAPISNENFLFSKILIRRKEHGSKAIYGTLRVMDDTTADFTILPPKEKKVLEYEKYFRNLPEILEQASNEMPFQLDRAKLGSASLQIKIKFDTIVSKGLRESVLDRLSYLDTLLIPTNPPKKEQKPFLSYRYKAVNNFISQKSIDSFLTYMLSRRGLNENNEEDYVKKLSDEFELSQAEAYEYFKAYLERKKDITTSDSEGREFIVKENPGIDISVYPSGTSSFDLYLYNIRAVEIKDIQRVCTVLGLAFYGTDEQWDEVTVKENNLKASESAEIVEEEAENQEKEIEEGAEQGEDEEDFFLLMGNDDEEKGEEEVEIETEKEQPIPKQELQKKTVKKVQEKKEGQRVLAYGWFISKLQQLDPELFAYKMPKETKTKHYSSKCANNEDRYPLILTEEQYQQMRKIYATAEGLGKVGFVIYGVPNTKDMILAAKGKKEQITVLRYGSDPTKPYYFLCAKRICLLDLLPILEDDWFSNEDYEEKQKPRESCPFCHGKKIQDPTKAVEGETVFVRKNKPKFDYGHYYVGFLKDKNPDGYELPCCFVSRKDIEWKDERLKSIRDASKSAEEEDEEGEDEKDDMYRGKSALVKDYDIIRWRLGEEYVLDSNKYPLEPGKIGMPSKKLDEYFGQNSALFIERDAVTQKFTTNTKGFFKMGVLNRFNYVNDSFFSALAPILGFNTIPAVAKHFSDLITPRIFISLNFGNLMLEFYDPTDKDFSNVSDDLLARWAQKHLLITDMEDTRFEIRRFYISYHRFIRYINNPNQRKQMRHFVHALAEPNLLAPEGLNLVTLRYKGDPRNTNTPIEVLCPIMGLDINRYSNNSVAFLTFSDIGFYEPIIYIENIGKTTETKSDAYYTITQYQLADPLFPPTVKERYLNEFFTKCQSGYRGAFTLQSGIDNRVLIPVSRALTILSDAVPTGLVRDSYNHLVAITIKNPYGALGEDILVPVVDDGNSFHNNTALKIHLGFTTVNLASANDTYAVYEKIVSPRLFPISNVYKIDTFMSTNKIIGFSLGGSTAYASLLLPCGPAKQSSSIQIPSDKITQSDMKKMRKDDEFLFEYKINHEIITSTNEDKINLEQESSQFVVEKKHVDMIYEHFRLSFSNWISSEAGSEIRKYIEKLLGVKPGQVSAPLPVYEKMRRLDVYLRPVLEQWFISDNEKLEIGTILLRKDCISITDDESACTGMCKLDDNNQCKIHTPEKVQIRSTPTETYNDATDYFITRLLDEILRIPSKRFELLNKMVKKIQVPSTNIHIGKEWILPENVPAWYDLLRGEITQGKEKPSYYEEFSRTADAAKEMEDLEEQGLQLYPVPQNLLDELPEESAEKFAVQVIGNPDDSRANRLRQYFGIRRSKEDAGIDLTPLILSEISQLYKIPIIQVQVSQAPIIALGRSEGSRVTSKSSAYVILPDFEKGPALLVMKEDLSDTIPTALLKGKLFDSIETLRRIIRKK
jgi:hypothetical protein